MFGNIVEGDGDNAIIDVLGGGRRSVTRGALGECRRRSAARARLFGRTEDDGGGSETARRRGTEAGLD